MGRAKIVATFGPAVAGYARTRALLTAGVDVARLNMSHGDHQVHDTTYLNIRAAAAELGRDVGIMAGLQGPKIRLGRFLVGPHHLAVGDRFTITVRDVDGTREICPTTFAGLPRDVRVGDALLIDDGKVALRATDVTDHEVITEVTVPGAVSNNKGINLPGVPVDVPALSLEDEEDLRWAKPVIVATQVLESMIDSPRPTRAEASDCANAVLDGADAVMLSGETSVGAYPVGAVQTMARIVTSTEAHGLERIPPLGSARQTRGGAITVGAVGIAEQLQAHSICTFTQTGDSARRLARLRPTRPLYAFTPAEDVRNQLPLAWGIHPLLTPVPAHTDEMTAHIDAVLLDKELAAPDDLVVMAAGSPPGVPGSTNLVKLHQVGEQSCPDRSSSQPARLLHDS